MVVPTTVPTPSLPIAQLMTFPTLEQAVKQVAERYDFQQHPYFLWMRSLETHRATFLNTQLPFCHAVESFSQALAALFARIPSVEARMALLENIHEEHGHGNPLRSHKATFRQYLQSLGATAQELEFPITTTILAFNQALLNYCLTQSPESSAAMLGMIEYLYVGISHTISRTIHDRGWVQAGSQTHYATHEKLDVDHARDLLQLSDLGWQQPLLKPQIAQGLLLGAHYFWGLYADMLPESL
jgi:pyrroloquinoline-quinone synthase